MPSVLIGFVFWNPASHWLVCPHCCGNGWPAVTWQFGDPNFCVLAYKHGACIYAGLHICIIELVIFFRQWHPLVLGSIYCYHCNVCLYIHACPLH